MRKYLLLTVRQYAYVLRCGMFAAYSDIRQGNVDAVTIGKKKIRVPAIAVEKKLGLAPGELDVIIDTMDA
jgi:hypothetical protein